MADFTEPANLLLRSFVEKATPLLRQVNIQIVTDLELHEEQKDSFSCSVDLKQGEKQLPPENIYVSFTNFPMIKFFGRTWTEFQGVPGLSPIVTGIEDRFRHVKL